MTTPTPHGAPELPEPNVCEVMLGDHRGSLSYYTEQDLLDYAKTKQSQRERVYESLLKQCVGQLKAWHSKYGENGPSWLPPSGDVRLLETIDDWLNSAPEYPIPSPRAAIQQAAGAVPEAKLLRKILACTHGDPQRKSPKHNGKWLTVMMRPELWEEIEIALADLEDSGSSDHLVPCAGGGVTQPLTDEQIIEALDNANLHKNSQGYRSAFNDQDCSAETALEIARAIEAAHGINPGSALRGDGHE